MVIKEHNAPVAIVRIRPLKLATKQESSVKGSISRSLCFMIAAEKWIKRHLDVFKNSTGQF